MTTTITELRNSGNVHGAWEMLLRACHEDRSHIELREILLDHVIGRYQDQHPDADTSAFLGLDWLRSELAQSVDQLCDPATTAESLGHADESPPLWPLEYPKLRESFETVERSIKALFLGGEEGESSRIHLQLEAMLHVGTACWFYRHATEPESRSVYRKSHLWEAMLRHLCQGARFYVAVHCAPLTTNVTVCNIHATPHIEENADLDHVFERLGSLDTEDDLQARFWLAAVSSVRLLFNFLLPARLLINHAPPRLTNILVLADTPNGHCPVCVTLEMSQEEAVMRRVCIPDPIAEGLRIVDEKWMKTQRRLHRFMRQFGIYGHFIWRLRFPDIQSSKTLKRKYTRQVLGRSRILPGMLRRPIELRGSSAGGAFALLLHLHKTQILDVRSCVVIAGITAHGTLKHVEQFEKLTSAPLVAATLKDKQADGKHAGWVDHRAAFVLDQSADQLTRNWVLHTLRCRLYICSNSCEAASVVTGIPAREFGPPVNKPPKIDISRDHVETSQRTVSPGRRAARRRLRRACNRLLQSSSGAVGAATAIIAGVMFLVITVPPYVAQHLLSDGGDSSALSSSPAGKALAPIKRPPTYYPPDVNFKKRREVTIPLVRLNISSAVKHSIPTLKELSTRLLDPSFQFMLEQHELVALQEQAEIALVDAKFAIYLAEIHAADSLLSEPETTELWRLRLVLEPDLHCIWFTASQEEEFRRPVDSVVDQESILLQLSDRTTRIVILVFWKKSVKPAAAPQLFLKPLSDSESL